MESSSNSDFEYVPWEISNIAAAATAQLLPEKSKSRYKNVYDLFTKWMDMKQCKTITEDVILAYLAQKSETVKCSTLLSMYSMLKSTILVKKTVNIATFSKVIAFLKRKNVGYKAKKSEVFSSEQINKFIREADNETYLMLKRLANEFIEDEAELSPNDNVCISDDEEDGQDQDFYDASFVADESHHLDTQMHCKYLQSIRSPVIPGGFKIPRRLKRTKNVFSQEVNSEDETYLEDSFVVDEDEVESNEELSQLEILEQKLEMQRKKRKKNNVLKPAIRKRIAEHYSDDSS